MRRAVVGDATGVDVGLEAECTLFENRPVFRARSAVACVVTAAADLVPGVRVAVHEPESAKRFPASAGRCFEIDASLSLAAGCLMPPLAEVLCALRRAAPELGSNAVVAGADPRAELLMAVLGAAGMRSTTSIRAAAAPEPVYAVEHSFRFVPGEQPEELQVHLERLHPPVVAFVLESSPGATAALLRSLPERSTLVLLDGAVPAPAAIDFYRDVHRKNVRIVGTSFGSVTAGDARRATRLLAENRIAIEALGLETVAVAPGRTPEPGRGRWTLVRWSDGTAAAGSPEA